MIARVTACITRYPLIAYFVLAYGISWILWSPFMAASQGLLPFETLPLPLEIVVSAGNYGPALSAIILTTVLNWLTVALLIIFFGAKRLTRKAETPMPPSIAT